MSQSGIEVRVLYPHDPTRWREKTFPAESLALILRTALERVGIHEGKFRLECIGLRTRKRPFEKTLSFNTSQGGSYQSLKGSKLHLLLRDREKSLEAECVLTFLESHQPWHEIHERLRRL